MAIRSDSRKFILTAHIIFSVAWLGTVAGFLTLAIVGLISKDALVVRSAYLSMRLITWYVILPLSITSPLTGLVLALGTRWGLFRHYWVLIKFLITTGATIVLLIHLQPINLMANIAATSIIEGSHLGGDQVQLLIAPSAALLVFITNATLAVYKPKGLTQYGQRKQLISN